MSRLSDDPSRESEPGREEPPSAPVRGDARSDEDILRILHDGENAPNLAELCAAENITVKTYYLWKVKYGDLTPFQLRRRRLRDRWYRRGVVALAGAALIGIGYVIVVGLGAPAQRQPANPPRSAARPPSAPSASPPAPRPAANEVAMAGDVSRGHPNAPAIPTAAATATAPAAADVSEAVPEGYSVQVAAVASLQDALATLGRLHDAGYAAYLSRTTAGEVQLYRVRVGPFESRRPAEDMAHRLERDGYRGAWVANK